MWNKFVNNSFTFLLALITYGLIVQLGMLEQWAAVVVIALLAYKFDNYDDGGVK